MNDIMSVMLAGIKDKPFTIKMTRSGKILEVKNINFIFEHMLDSLPKLSPEQRKQFIEQMNNSYGEKSFKGSFELVTAMYTIQPVATGSSWKTVVRLEGGMAAKVINTYTWKGKTAGYNLVTGAGTLTTVNSNAYRLVNGMMTRYDLTGPLTTTIKTDPETGWIIEAKVNEQMSGKAEIKDNPKLPGGLLIPMSVVNVMEYSGE